MWDSCIRYRSMQAVWIRIWSYPMRQYRSYLMRLMLYYWRWQMWEEVAKRHRFNCIPHNIWRQRLNGDAGLWDPLILHLPVYKGLRLSHSLQGILALSLTCARIRSSCLRNLFQYWKEIRMAVKNPANAQHLDGISWLLVVKLASTGYTHSGDTDIVSFGS